MDLKTIKEQILPLVNEMGYELFSLTSRAEKGQIVLSFVLDRVEPIDMNAIIAATDKISTFLDEQNLIEEEYVLDVSSLGIEKPIEVGKLTEYVGRYVNLHLVNPIKGLNVIEGVIKSASEDSIAISYLDKTRKIQVELDLKNILKARLAVKF